MLWLFQAAALPEKQCKITQNPAPVQQAPFPLSNSSRNQEPQIQEDKCRFDVAVSREFCKFGGIEYFCNAAGLLSAVCSGLTFLKPETINNNGYNRK